jgi:hypothetical protein
MSNAGDHVQRLSKLVDHFHQDVKILKNELQTLVSRIEQLEKQQRKEAPEDPPAPAPKKKRQRTSTSLVAKMKKQSVNKKKAQATLLQEEPSPLILVRGDDVYKKISNTVKN